MLRTHQEASAYDFSIIEAPQAQSLTGDCQGIDAPAAHACNARRLNEAVHGLARRAPEFSASSGLWGWQAAVLACLAIMAGTGALFAAQTTFVALLVLLAIPFLFVVALRAVSLWHFLRPPISQPALDADRAKDEDLPNYTILVPLFYEATIVPDLICALGAIDYPEHRLHVLLIVESIDRETRAALRAADLRPHMHILIMADSNPRTKPRACQYALQFATGAYVVVYDAEDWLDPAHFGMDSFRACRNRYWADRSC